MKHPTFFTVLGYLFVTLAGTGYASSVSANAVSDCRREAQDYGIATEELDVYIDGCLVSRGELIDGDTADMEYVPPVETDETDDLPDPQKDDTDVAQ